MGDCRFCVNWVDENLEEIASAERDDGTPYLFFGCKIYGNVEDWTRRADTCPDYRESPDLYGLCASCAIVVPKVCLSMGTCVNCLNTDLFCVEQCIGGALNTYCTHFVRLRQEGLPIIVASNTLADLYPEPPKPDPQGEKPLGDKPSEKS